mgnify:CR=1 FL=1
MILRIKEVCGSGIVSDQVFFSKDDLISHTCEMKPFLFSEDSYETGFVCTLHLYKEV